MILAAIDLGTNSSRLLISRCNQGKTETILRELRTNRLGGGMNAGGLIKEDSRQKTAQYLEEFKEIMAAHRVEGFHTVATSAVREAKNRAEFIEFLYSATGIRPEILSARREAELSYRGALKAWQGEGKLLLVDLGGGSTEIIWYTDQAHFTSLPIGAVRGTEAAMSMAEMAAIIASLGDVKEELRSFSLVMTGGTATTLAAVKLSLEVYDAEQIHGARLSRREIGDIYNLTAGMSLRLRQRLPGLQPERADIIVKGIEIVLLLMDFLDKDMIIISENDILDGIIDELYTRGDG